MTLQREDIKLLEELIRKVVREELESIVNKANTGQEYIDDDEFLKATTKIFTKHKKVLDALA